MQSTDTVTSYPTTACATQGGAVQAGSGGPNQAFYYANAGVHDPCYPYTRPMGIVLAVDINGNGVRDYGEPIVANAHERFQDTGVDGCSDPMEDGKGGCVTDPSKSPYDANTNPDPNGDDYDFRHQPARHRERLALREGRALRRTTASTACPTPATTARATASTMKSPPTRTSTPPIPAPTSGTSGPRSRSRATCRS